METMKFLMISTHYPPHNLGGDAKFVQYLSNELVKRGHEVHVLCNPAVFTLLRRTNPQGSPQRSAPEIHTHVPSMPRLELLSGLMLGGSDGARRDSIETIRRINPDVIHWHNTKGFLGLPYPVRGLISIYTAHDYYAVCARSNLLKPDLSVCMTPKLCLICNMRWGKPPPLWRIGKKRVLRFQKNLRVISPSVALANRLKEDGIVIDRILRNFVPDPGKLPEPEVGNSKTIVYLGMLEPHKGPQTLLKAFHSSRNEQGFTLFMIGEGSLKTRLRQMASDLGLGERVTVTGFLPREELESIRSRAVAQVIPSEWPENAPLTAIEALSQGVPLIGSDLGGLPEMLTSESGSMVFKGGESDQLAQRLIKAWTGSDRLSEMRRMARRAYEDNYAPEVHISQYLEMIRKIETV